MSSDLGTWWDELSAAALVGTARRRVPAQPAVVGPGRVDAAREVALLDGAALGSALRQAGVRTGAPEPVDQAGEDLRPSSPPRATQLLELLLHQSPVGPTLKPLLVQAWLDAADGHGCRSPHHLLPELFDLASQQERLRPGVVRVGDARGEWLAAANPAWSWAAKETTGATTAVDRVDAAEWARQPTDRRAADVARLRRTDPGAARALVESAWTSEAAADRVTLLNALRKGIGPADEPLLEQALDDRSSKLREVAVQLLDSLPGSARAARMSARLRPLVQLKGLVRKSLEIDLPVDPDDAGVRDGLSRPKGVGSVRGWWLQRLAAGAPLEVWTETTGADAAGAWRLVSQRDARVGIVEAVLARGDSTWAAAIVTDVWHPGLLALVPADRLDAAASRQLAGAKTADQVIGVVGGVPTPWGPVFSRAVLQRLMAEKDPTVLVAQLTVRLATGLDPVARPALEKWRDSLESGARERVARLCQYLSLVPEISEAFG